MRLALFPLNFSLWRAVLYHFMLSKGWPIFNRGCLMYMSSCGCGNGLCKGQTCISYSHHISYHHSYCFFWVWLWCCKKEKDIIILAILSGSKINREEVIWILMIFPLTVKGKNAHISWGKKKGFPQLVSLNIFPLTVSKKQVKRWSCLNINVKPTHRGSLRSNLKYRTMLRQNGSRLSEKNSPK